MDTLVVLKLIILAYIVISPFISYKYMTFINATPIKILILLLIIVVSFIDLQLAVLLMIAFLILLVNLNKGLLSLIKKTVTSEESASLLIPKVLSEIGTMSNVSSSVSTAPQSGMSTVTPPVSGMPQNIQTKETMVRGNSLFPIPSDIVELPEKMYNNPDGVTERFVDEDMLIDPKLDFRMTQAHLENQVQEQIREQTHEPVHAQTMYEFPKPYCKNLQHLDPYLISNNLFLYSTDDRTKPYEEYVKILSPESALKDVQTNEV